MYGWLVGTSTLERSIRIFFSFIFTRFFNVFILFICFVFKHFIDFKYTNILSDSYQQHSTEGSDVHCCPLYSIWRPGHNLYMDTIAIQSVTIKTISHSLQLFHKIVDTSVYWFCVHVLVLIKKPN